SLSARRLPATLAVPGRDTALANAVLGAADEAPSSSCAAVTAAGGRRIIDKQAAAALTPASTQKVVTAWAALRLLGPDHKLHTSLASVTPPSGGVLTGDLYLVGGGDPTLETAAHAASFVAQPHLHTDLAALADGLVARGVRQLRGRLVGDESRYDAVRYVGSWPRRYVSQNQTGPLSALTVNRGFTTFPASGQEFGGSGARRPAEEPALHAAQVLRDLLAERGVSVSGVATAVGVAPPGASELAAVDSAPLSELVGHMLRESDNHIAESLVKEIGKVKGGAGATAAGVAAIAQALGEAGFAAPEQALLDGSGLDPGNRLSCSQLVSVLVNAGRSSKLGEGLAVAGQSGTLVERLGATAAAGRVRAKTGSLPEVSSLAGFVDTAPGEVVVFASIVNGRDPDAYKQLEDEIAQALVTYPVGPSLAELSPKAPA
ncbi:MAG: D-alanyl-D-alanine carboxypeptidase/D-alanyl-D-alanine-endopeptidase, partial [Acidimicrobiales bacterium]